MYVSTHIRTHIINSIGFGLGYFGEISANSSLSPDHSSMPFHLIGHLHPPTQNTPIESVTHCCQITLPLFVTSGSVSVENWKLGGDTFVFSESFISGTPLVGEGHRTSSGEWQPHL